MRECIYCGKQLEKGEQCNCALSVARRNAKKDDSPKSKADIKKEAKEKKQQEKERAREEKQRRKEEAASRNRARRTYAYNAGMNFNRNAFSNVWYLIKCFIKSPIETVHNPSMMGWTETVILVLLEGAIAGLSIFSIITGASRGPLRLLGNLLGFRGTGGYNTIFGWIGSAFSGALGGFLMFLLYTLIFYAVNKWVLKGFTGYRDFSRRFAFVAIPVSVIGAVGVILGFFSQTTFAILLICGLTGTVALTYEILRSVWHSFSASKTMYFMMLCMFIFIMIVLYFIRLSVM